MNHNRRVTMQRLIKKMTFLFILGFLSANGVRDITDGCDLPDSEITGYLHLTADGSVLYKSPEAIAGWQFTVDGATVNSASGGDSEAEGLLIQSLESTVLAFSLSGGSIPAGCGTLVELVLSGDATGLSGIVVSDIVGNAIDFEYYEDDDDLECPEGTTNGQPDNICVPIDFSNLNQSTTQAAYFFTYVTLNGNP